MQKRGLGKGLSSLIPQKTVFVHEDKEQDLPTSISGDMVNHVAITEIESNPYQPRMHFDDVSLKELAESISLHGIMSPLVVTRVGNRYELIAGERRLRAARMAGLSQVPVLVRTADEQEKFELALIENVQREDLDPLELAHAYRRLIDEFSLTQDAVGKQLGTPRSSIANTLRLLTLPADIQESLRCGEITEGHAKTILSLPDEQAQRALWKKITLNTMSVRAAEREAKHIDVARHTRVIVRDPELEAIEQKLEEKFGTRVSIKGTRDKGNIIIDYFSKEDLDALLVS